MKLLKVIISLVFIAATVLLCFSGPLHEADGSAEYLIGSAKVQLTSGVYPSDAKTLNTVVSERDIPMLRYFPDLVSADFTGSTCYEQIARWAQENPQVQVRYSIPLPNGSSLESDVESLDLSWMKTADVPAVAQAIGLLGSVKSIDLGTIGTEELELGALANLKAAAPEAAFEFDVNVAGTDISADAESIDLSNLKSGDAADAAVALGFMKNLKSVDLGSQSKGSLEWKDIAALKAACPDAKFSYSFTLYGQELTLDTEKLDFRGTKVKDNGDALYSVLACMNNCTYLDMDSTGVEDKVLGNLRELFPQTEIVWRVWFGENYSVRTDAERILASKPTVGGMITDTSCLQYCTKVKYLDIGHNYELADFSFVAKMPDLEVAIIAMTSITDISGLANCSKLDYLELNSTNVSDISVLKNCTSLKHLNIASCPEITDMSAVLSLTGLERLWIGRETPVPEDQIKQMRSLAPNCVINTTVSDDPTGESWRYTGYDPEIPLYFWVDRYELLREQMGYNYQEYSFYWLDPYCDLEAPAEHAGKYGKEVYGL